MSEKRRLGGNCQVSEEMQFYLLVLFVSLAVFKVLMQVHEPDLESLADASLGVIKGRPHWITFQNRLLGPYTVYVISKVGISYVASLRIYILLMTIAQSTLLFTLLLKRNLSYKKSLTYLVIFSFIFISVQDYWFYSWDNIDLLIFMLFSFGIFQGVSVRFYLILFFIALLNRESALFISLYIIIDSFSYNIKSIKRSDTIIKLVSINKLFVGILMMIVGIGYTKIIREYLFDYKTLGKNLSLRPPLGNFISFSNNMSNLLYHNLASLNVINTVFIVGSTIYLASFIRYYSECHVKALLVYGCIVINIMIFGTINETRMFIILIPFLIFFQTEIEKFGSKAEVTFQRGNA